MGVHGLWRLIEPSGKPVPLETLENKILAVDISIWLHQAVKGFQDARGAALPNAHLLGIYHRLCKLLYFRIKPVFIFDGGVPVLKKQTIARRNQQSSKIRNDATTIQQKILSTLLKHSAIQKVISEETNTDPTSTNKAVPFNTNAKDDMFQLPSPLPTSDLDTTVDSDSSETSESSPSKHQFDLHTIDEKSVHFTSLPAEVRHDILTDLKEQRKQSSWGRLHELPKQSGDFSSFQMKRLLKRYSVQVCLEEATKEMGGHTLSLNELETLLTEEGIVTASKTSTRRIASDENKSYLLIKDVKKAMETAKIEEENAKKIKEKNISSEDNTNSSTTVDDEDKANTSVDSEYERDLKTAIEMSLMDTPSTSKEVTNFDYLENLNDGDFVSDSDSDDCTKSSKYVFSAAESYMLEFSDLTPYEIAKIVNKNDKNNKKTSKKNKSKIDIHQISELTENGGHKNIFQEEIIAKPIENTNKQDIHISHIKKALKFDDLKSENEFKISEVTKDTNTTKIDNKDVVDTVEIISDSDESDLIEVQETKELIDTKIDNIEKKLNIENLKSFVITKLTENNSENDNKIETISDEASDFVVVQKTKELTDLLLTENKTKNDNNIETMSDSGGSDFVEVQETKELTDTETDNIAKKLNMENLKSFVITNPIENTSKESDKIKPNIQNENKIETIETMSDSEGSDFLEVEDNISKTEAFEVVINPTSKLEDDLFSDIFEEPNKLKPESEITNMPKITINEPISKDVDKQITNKTVNDQTVDKHVQENLLIAETTSVEPVNKESQKIVKDKPKLSIEELNKLQLELIQDQKELITERNTKERMAGDITNQMYLEAQELLELFGCPYIIAPMEAEAQCAFLNDIKLTDGTITDDSDIWLFGGQTVYKNFFNQKKHVMEYRAERIKQYFKLSREQMILLALLVGSDYTLGIQGIGPVTALEILAAFPPSKTISQNELISGLSEFRHWLKDGRTLGPGRTTLRSKLQNINISDGFPNLNVVQAYLQPEVETSRDAFSWGKPDFVALIDYAKEKFGWTRFKTEEILKPVTKKIEETGKQKSIRDYFATKHKVETDLEGKMSKRVKIAVNKMGKTKEELQNETEKTVVKSKRKVNLKKLTAEKNDCVENKPLEPETKSKKKVNLEKLTKEKSFKSKQVKNTESKPKVQRKKGDLHKEEKIPQKEFDKVCAIRTKLRAIEVYRKSKIDKKTDKKPKQVRKPKDEAELSESSDSS